MHGRAEGGDAPESDASEEQGQRGVEDVGGVGGRPALEVKRVQEGTPGHHEKQEAAEVSQLVRMEGRERRAAGFNQAGWRAAGATVRHPHPLVGAWVDGLWGWAATTYLLSLRYCQSDTDVSCSACWRRCFSLQAGMGGCREGGRHGMQDGQVRTPRQRETHDRSYCHISRSSKQRSSNHAHLSQRKFPNRPS